MAKLERTGALEKRTCNGWKHKNLISFQLPATPEMDLDPSDVQFAEEDEIDWDELSSEFDYSDSTDESMGEDSLEEPATPESKDSLKRKREDDLRPLGKKPRLDLPQLVEVTTEPKPEGPLKNTKKPPKVNLQSPKPKAPKINLASPSPAPKKGPKVNLQPKPPTKTLPVKQPKVNLAVKPTAKKGLSDLNAKVQPQLFNPTPRTLTHTSYKEARYVQSSSLSHLFYRTKLVEQKQWPQLPCREKEQKEISDIVADCLDRGVGGETICMSLTLPVDHLVVGLLLFARVKGFQMIL